MPSMGSSLKEIGSRTAMARTVVSPGIAPTNMPTTSPAEM